MADMCGDNRFEIIARAKEDLLEGTNIETDEAEMAVIDDILFRCWQMGWLDRYDRKTENSSEKPNNCEDLQDWKDRMWAEAIVTEPTISKMEQVDRDINVRSKTEPQTIRCPKCGRSDYIREFGKDFSVTAEEAGFKYKCINCNTYIEPQSDRKTEPTISKMEQVDKDINVRSKDEPQTEREGE